MNATKNAIKKKVLVIIPDRFTKASGGMGENSAPVFERLSSEFDFYVAGFPLAGEQVPAYIKEYKEVATQFTEVRSRPLIAMISQIDYLAAAISFPKPDLVYAYDWSIYLAAVKAAKFFGVPLVARMALSAIELAEARQTFGLDLSMQLPKALHNAMCEMEIRGLRSADRIVHVSNGYAKRWQGIAGFPEKSMIVPNGIDLARWQHVPRGPENARLKVVYIGRLSISKGVLALCNARVPEGIDLVFIGSKEFSEPVCVQAIENNVRSHDNISYIGPLYGEAKIRALRNADAIIVPSLHEPFGTVGLESLAAECITLSSRVDGLGDYLNDETSIYCGTTSVEIEQAFAALVALSADKKARMKAAGLATCEIYSLASTADKLRGVFNELS